MENWKTKNLTDTYLEGVRSAIPFATEQMEILLRLIKFFKPDMKSFLDLGCGDGVLGKMLLANWPASKGIFVDFSEPMIVAAQSNCREYKDTTSFYIQDFGVEGWIASLSNILPVDVVISGFSIHHQKDANKKRLYQEILDTVLKSGGVFLNLEQVKSETPEIESIFNEFFMDGMRKSQKENNIDIPIEAIEKEFYKDKLVNKLTPVEKQCNWLREIGFKQVDCYVKAFELSIFGGVKP